MINKNEIRIGNIIQYKEKLLVVYDWVLIDILTSSNEELKDYSYIPITPEILEKCGFIETDDCFLHKKIKIHQDYTSFYWGDEVRIYYLHKLQNLYFALTNEELNVQL